MTTVPFEDIELTKRESELLDCLLNNGTVPGDGAGARLIVKLKSAMPDATWHGLLAAEFMRRQDAILRPQVVVAEPATPPALAVTPSFSDEEIDAQFCFYVCAKAKSAGA